MEPPPKSPVTCLYPPRDPTGKVPRDGLESAVAEWASAPAMDEGEHTGWWSYGQNDGELVTALALQRSPPLEANAFSQELIGAAQGSRVLQDLQIDLQRGLSSRRVGSVLEVK